MNKKEYDFTVDECGIPKGQCLDCDHSKFEFESDKWYCRSRRETGKCNFILVPVIHNAIDEEEAQ